MCVTPFTWFWPWSVGHMLLFPWKIVSSLSGWWAIWLPRRPSVTCLCIRLLLRSISWYLLEWKYHYVPSAGTIRLAGGDMVNEGRVEIFHDGQWGTVCDDSWDNSDAIVVCRSLGYLSGKGVDEYGGGSGPIWMDEVMCKGSENSLEDCPRNAWGDQDCGHSEDAGVICGKRSQ